MMIFLSITYRQFILRIFASTFVPKSPSHVNDTWHIQYILLISHFLHEKLSYSPLQEKILLNAMFETPGSDVIAITVTSDAVNGKADLEYTRRSDFEQAAALWSKEKLFPHFFRSSNFCINVF